MKNLTKTLNVTPIFYYYVSLFLIKLLSYFNSREEMCLYFRRGKFALMVFSTFDGITRNEAKLLFKRVVMKTNAKTGLKY